MQRICSGSKLINFFADGIVVGDKIVGAERRDREIADVGFVGVTFEMRIREYRFGGEIFAIII